MTESVQSLRMLGLLLATKTLLLALSLAVFREDLSQLLIAGSTAAALVGLAKFRAWGSAALVVGLTLRVAVTLPHTLNHAWFELLVSLVLWRAAAAPSLRITVQARVVLRAAILSVFFFSALQKLVHGQFASGESMLRAVVFESDPTAQHVRWALQPFGALPVGDVHQLLLRPVPLELPSHLPGVLRLVSLGIIAAELVLPALVLLGVRGSRWALLITQVGIGVGSGELDFALTATGLVLLLWRAPPPSTWVATFVGWALVGVAMALG